MRVAVLESRPELAERILKSLGRAGFVTYAFAEVRDLLHCLRRETFDIFVFDWMAEGLQSSKEVMALRSVNSHAPILVIAHHYHEPHLISALKQGADVYMVNPLRSLELVARAQALLRRAYPSSCEASTSFESYIFLEQQNKVMINGASVELMRKEFDMALFLFRNAGRSLSRGHIKDLMMQPAIDIAPRSLDVVMSRLRKKLTLNGSKGFKLSAVYGLGYCLEVSKATKFQQLSKHMRG